MDMITVSNPKMLILLFKIKFCCILSEPNGHCYYYVTIKTIMFQGFKLYSYIHYNRDKTLNFKF